MEYPMDLEWSGENWSDRTETYTLVLTGRRCRQTRSVAVTGWPAGWWPDSAEWAGIQGKLARILDYRLARSLPGEGRRRRRGEPRRRGRRAAARLAARQAQYEAEQARRSPAQRRAYRKPGSTSGRK